MPTEPPPLTVLVPLEMPVRIEGILETLNRFIPERCEYILLHVADTAFLETLKIAGEKRADEIFQDLKKSAQAQLGQAVASFPGNAQPMVVEGDPFVEIIKLSRDLQVDLIAMQMRSHNKPLENFFFGSTTEKVLRAVSRPVICIP